MHPVATLAPDELEQHRAPLTGYSYRMLGSVTEAEDAVQETLLRAWRSWDGFEGRASRRTWLYRIATNVCLDMLKARQRRARPMEMGPSWSFDGPVGEPGSGERWIEPIPDTMVDLDDPAEVAVTRETIRLAFVAALQHLPPKAESHPHPSRGPRLERGGGRRTARHDGRLGQQCPATGEGDAGRGRARRHRPRIAFGPGPTGPARPIHGAPSSATTSTRSWRCSTRTSPKRCRHTRCGSGGPDQVRDWMAGPGIACKGSRLIPTVANGSPAFGQYRVGSRRKPSSLGAARARDLRRRRGRSQFLPRHRHDLPALRVTAPARRDRRLLLAAFLLRRKCSISVTSSAPASGCISG